MKYSQHAPRRSKVGCHTKTARLILRAETDEEMAYLAWLTNQVRCGNARQLYYEEKAKEPDVLAGLTDDHMRNAREVYRSGCEGRGVQLDLGEVEDLERVGLVRDLRVLPGRGRYAGRFEFMPTDRLEIVVRAMAALGLATL